MFYKIILSFLILIGSVFGAFDPDRTCRGQITYSAGTPSATATDGCVTSVTDNGAGDATINFASGYFSAAPTCLCVPARSAAGTCQEGGNGVYTSPTTSAARLSTRDSTSSFVDGNFNFLCWGKK